MTFNNYTQKSLEAVQSAQNIAVQHSNQQLEQIHLLLALLQQDGGLTPQLLRKMGVNAESLEAAAKAEVRNLPTVTGSREADRFYISAAVEVSREIRELNPENGYAPFILAQCYAASGCIEAFWAAYDVMKDAEELFEDETLKEKARVLASAYAGRWPLSNDEKFFMEGIKAGQQFTITCGAASGVRTIVRFR